MLALRKILAVGLLALSLAALYGAVGVARDLEPVEPGFSFSEAAETARVAASGEDLAGMLARNLGFRKAIYEVERQALRAILANTLLSAAMFLLVVGFLLYPKALRLDEKSLTMLRAAFNGYRVRDATYPNHLCGCSGDLPNTLCGCSGDLPNTLCGCSGDLPNTLCGCSGDLPNHLCGCD